MFEYDFTTYNDESEHCVGRKVVEGATEMAKQGWRLVSVVRTIRGPRDSEWDDCLTAFFERRKVKKRKRVRR